MHEFVLTQQDVEKIVADLWNNRKTIVNKVLPHLRRHSPRVTVKKIEAQIKFFLDHFKREGVGQERYFIETGRLRLEVDIEEYGLGWSYNVGFTEKYDNCLFDDDMCDLCRKEW